MSKIDKIIQILRCEKAEDVGLEDAIFGLSESGSMYVYHSPYYDSGDTYHPAQWILEVNSPVVDNSPREDFEQELRRVELEVMEDRARIRTTQDAVNHILDKGA